MAHKMAVLSAFPFTFRQQSFQHFDLLRIQERIVLPTHGNIPCFGIMVLIQINLIVNPGQAHQRRHSSPNLAAGIQHPHPTFIINIFRRLLIKPYPILAGSLKTLPALITAFKTNHRGSAMHALYQNKINYTRVRTVSPAFAHHNFFNPFSGQIRKQLFLGNIPLHLLRQTDHPAFSRSFYLPKRMNTSGIPYGFHCPALCFSCTVAAEYPSVSFAAGMKFHLLFMSLFPQIVSRQFKQLRMLLYFLFNLLHGTICVFQAKAPSLPRYPVPPPAFVRCFPSTI